jgi:hypothetical protein
VTAPPGAKIAWLGVDASFQTHQGVDAAKTRNSIAYATTLEGPFTEVYRASMPTDVNHWHTHAYHEIRLPEPTREALIQFHGDPGLNAFTIYAHCIDDLPIRRPAMTVTHAWREAAQRKTQTVRLDGVSPYAIEIPVDATDVENESIELAVPNSAQ